MSLSQFGIFLFVVFFVAHSFSDDSIRVEKNQAAGLAVGAAVGTTGGIMTAVKYQQFKTLNEKKIEWLPMFSRPEGVKDVAEAGVIDKTLQVAKGDAVEIQYLPTEEEFRKKVIADHESMVQWHRSQLGPAEEAAKQALRGDDNAKTESLFAVAKEHREEVKKHLKEIEDIQKGKILTVEPLKIQFEEAENNGFESRRVINKTVASGGKIVSMKRIPAEFAARAKATLIRGGAWGVATLVGVGIVAGEVYSIQKSNQIEADQRDFTPSRSTSASTVSGSK